jgi:uncharacterized damage-inducible protein DinB
MLHPFLTRVYAHMEWADAVTWQTVLSHEAAGRDDYILDSLVHLHMVQRAYLSMWKGREVTIPKRSDFKDPLEIRDWARSYHPEVTHFLGVLSDERLGEVVETPWAALIEGEIGALPAPATLGETVFQVAAHSVHHRAQISRRVREVGGQPRVVDYIGWVWRGSPPADWSP